MLVLGRRLNEAVVIRVDGKAIRVMVVGIDSRGLVRLGFEGPALIVREELERRAKFRKQTPGA